MSRGRLMLALLGLSACAPAAVREFENGREPAFYADQLAAARVAPVAAAPVRAAEDSLARVAAEWTHLTAQPARLVKLIDLTTPTAQATIAAAAEARQLDAMLAAPKQDAVVFAVYARSPAIAEALHAWRASLSRYAQVSAYDDVLRRYNSWTQRSRVPVGPMQGKGTRSIAGSVPFPGRKGALGSLVTRDARIARDRYVARVNAVLTDARQTLHRLVYLDRAIRITTDHRKAVESQANVARTRYRAGSGPYVDVLKAGTELAELEDRLLTFGEARQAAAVALNTLLRRASRAPVGPVTPEPSPAVLKDVGTLETRVLAASLPIAMKTEALGRMRDMRGMAANRDDYKTLQRHYFFDGRKMPRAGAGRKRPAMDERPRRMPARDADSGLVTSFLAELTQRIRATEAGLEALNEQTKRQTETLYFQFDEARRRTLLYRQTVVPKARQTLAASETAYQGGSLTFINLVDALRRLLKALF